MESFLLIIHGLVAVALLGAVTHQAASVLWRGRPVHAAAGVSFTERYARVDHRAFTRAVVVLYVLSLALGAVIYPYYRLNVRIPFEEMRLDWAVGVFELKEHFAGIGLGVLPFYAYVWLGESAATRTVERTALTVLLALVVWWDFVVGHVLMNIRGFG
jgi:hypothetical protein